MRLTQFTAADRVRAFGHVIIAGIYFYIAQSISVHAAKDSGSRAPQLLWRQCWPLLCWLGYGS